MIMIKIIATRITIILTTTICLLAATASPSAETSPATIFPGLIPRGSPRFLCVSFVVCKSSCGSVFICVFVGFALFGLLCLLHFISLLVVSRGYPRGGAFWETGFSTKTSRPRSHGGGYPMVVHFGGALPNGGEGRDDVDPLPFGMFVLIVMEMHCV